MRRFWFALISLGCAAAAPVAGCGDVPEQPTGPTSGGTGGDSAPVTGGTGGTVCTVPADCGKDGDCIVRTCAGGKCGFTNLAMGLPATTQTAGDCKQQLCDGAGGVVIAADATDPADDGTLCTADLCMGKTPVFSPVGAGVACMDHGGTLCDGAGKCVGCLGQADCMTGVCSLGMCVDATCVDQMLDGTETDTDCGGGACAACPTGDKCLAATDCASGVCTAGVCS